MDTVKNRSFNTASNTQENIESPPEELRERDVLEPSKTGAGALQTKRVENALWASRFSGKTLKRLALKAVYGLAAVVGLNYAKNTLTQKMMGATKAGTCPLPKPETPAGKVSEIAQASMKIQDPPPTSQEPRVVLPALEAWQVKVSNGGHYHEAIEAAKEALKNPNKEVVNSAFNLVGGVVSAGESLEEAAQVAKGGFSNPDPHSLMHARALFRRLGRHQEFSQKGAKLAEEWLKSGDTHDQAAGLALLTYLKWGEHCPVKTVTDAAVTGMTSQDPLVQSYALELFQKLVNRKHSYQEAAEGGRKGMESLNSDVRSSAMGVWHQLLFTDYPLLEVLAVVKPLAKHENTGVQADALQLFHFLKARSQAEAREASYSFEGNVPALSAISPEIRAEIEEEALKAEAKIQKPEVQSWASFFSNLLGRRPL